MRPLALCLILCLAGAAPAEATAEAIRLDVTLAGLKVATMDVTGTAAAGRYAVTGHVRTTLGAGLLRKVRYEAEAEGQTRGNRYSPARYSEEIDTGRREASTRIAWTGGVPVASTAGRDAPPDGPPDPDLLRGAVDPLTALFAGMRETPRKDACGLRLTVFDGVRTSRVVLDNPHPDEGRITCRGLYTRIAGYSDAEMAERTTFAFSATYDLVGEDRLRLTEVRTQTIFGPAILRRQ